MVVSPKLLMEELKALRRGRGVQTPGVDKHVGPALREACRINEFDGAEVVRDKLRAWVSGLVHTFPEDLRLAVTTPLALHSEAQQAFLSDRIQWLADRDSRDSRTIRRRIDDGLTRLVEAALRPGATTSAGTSGWYAAELHALLRLDGTVPTCVERWSITAERDGIDEISWPEITNRIGDDGHLDHDVRVVHGVMLVGVGRQEPPRLRFPRALRAGETHEFSMEVPVSRFHSSHPSYLFRPLHRCDRFTLVVRFHLDRLPLEVSQVTQAFNQDRLADMAEFPLAVNALGEVEVLIREAHPGCGYGVRWTSRDFFTESEELPAPRASEYASSFHEIAHEGSSGRLHKQGTGHTV
jgi:hypothetical protein